MHRPHLDARITYASLQPDVWQLYCAIINYLRNLPKSGYSTHKGSFFAWISHVYKYLSVVHTFLTCQLLCAQAAKSCAHAKRRSRKYCARTLAPLGLFGISFRRADTRLISAGMPVSARSTPSSPDTQSSSPNHRGTHSRFYKISIPLALCSRNTPILQPRLPVNRISLQITGNNRGIPISDSGRRQDRTSREDLTTT